LAAALPLLSWLPSKDEAIARAGSSPPAPTRAAQDGLATPLNWLRQAAPAVAGLLPTAAPPAGRSLLPITVAAARTLRVGDMSEIVIALGPNAGAHEIGFTLQFDANVLQVRAGIEGDWAAGADARFVADISGAEDRVQIRRTAAAGRPAAAGGQVALVQFQAVAPGSTTVVISDVTVRDRAGQAIPHVLSQSMWQVTAESVPPRPLRAARARGLAPVETHASETTESGD
jgi:hypothetical protein